MGQKTAKFWTITFSKNLLASFIVLEAERRRNSEEKLKTIFHKFVLEFHFASISGVEGFIWWQKLTIVVPYCIACWAKIHRNFTGVKVTSGMGLPLLHEMSFQRHTQKKIRFWKLADRYKCAQPIGEIFPPNPFLFVHRKKRFTSFPSPAGMSLTKLPLGRNNSVMTSLFPPRESLVVTSRLGTGNSWTFFLRCSGGGYLTTELTSK